MEINLYLLLSLLIALLVISYLLGKLHRVRGQLFLIRDALNDIKAVNLNRRVLVRESDLTKQICYDINEIAMSSQSRLIQQKQSEQAYKRLMTSLSHDVRTPLTTLIGYLDAVHRQLVTGDEREAYMETARKKAHDLKEYIDILFDWFRLNSDEFAMDREILEAAELTRNILIDWIPVFEDTGFDYDIQIPDRPAQVSLDAECYRRILNNLIQNVLSHSHGSWVEIRMLQKAREVSISVSDNGVGMESEDLKHIFERLYKCDRARSEKGSGLGLSIARQLTEKMGGRITVQSQPGKGTRFTLTFPLCE